MAFNSEAGIEIRKADTPRGGYVLEAEQWLPGPRDEVFAFFSDARNLETITPPWLRFRVLSVEPAEMGPETVIDYRLRLRGLPVRWQSRIDVWEPPVRFLDRQVRGPYRWWVHAHSFDEREGGTSVRDRVQYQVPGGALVHRLFVRRDVLRIFAFRQQRLREIFGEAPRPKPGRY